MNRWSKHCRTEKKACVKRPKWEEIWQILVTEKVGNGRNKGRAMVEDGPELSRPCDLCMTVGAV